MLELLMRLFCKQKAECSNSQTGFVRPSVRRLIFAVTLVMAPFAISANADTDHLYDQQIIEILDQFQGGEFEQALLNIEQHLKKYPKSRLAKIVQGDIYKAMIAEPLALTELQQNDQLQGLQHEMQIRWDHHANNFQIAQTYLPANLIHLGKHKHVLVADMQHGRLYVYRNENGIPRLAKDYYLTLGSQGYGKQVEGDNKTPVGVYSFYEYIDGSELPDLYGKGAYPVDYPNVLDRYRKRTGYGIWLHGTPSDTYARSPYASEGCFVLSNLDLLDIQQFLDVNMKTPVVLADKVDWIDQQEFLQRQQQYLSVLAAWENDWESLDSDKYLSHYQTNEFDFGRTSFSKWAKNKRAINQNKTFIQIDLEVNGMFKYPGEDNLFVVDFTQRYLSSNYSGEVNKKQYWRLNSDGNWRIIYEG
jgi:murein L,D-transpeptidase YafK